MSMKSVNQGQLKTLTWRFSFLHSTLGTFLHSSCGTCRGTLLQTCFGTLLQTCLGTFWHCCLGTALHSCLGTFLHSCRRTCFGTYSVEKSFKRQDRICSYLLINCILDSSALLLDYCIALLLVNSFALLFLDGVALLLLYSVTLLLNDCFIPNFALNLVHFFALLLLDCVTNLQNVILWNRVKLILWRDIIVQDEKDTNDKASLQKVEITIPPHWLCYTLLLQRSCTVVHSLCCTVARWRCRISARRLCCTAASTRFCTASPASRYTPLHPQSGTPACIPSGK